MDLSVWHWYHWMAFGFVLGSGAAIFTIVVFVKWAEQRPYLPGPFARPDYDKKP